MLVKSVKWESIQIEHLASKNAEPDKIIFQWPKDILDYQGPSLIKNNPSMSGRRWRSGLEGLLCKQRVGCSNPSRDRPKS